jgi:hypothetical protein
MDQLAGFFPAGRDRGVTVVVEGFFAFVWFGWGQAAAPSWLVIPLAVGAGLAAPLTVAGSWWPGVRPGGCGPWRTRWPGAGTASPSSTITGVGAGSCLIGFGLATLLAGGRERICLRQERDISCT